MAKRKHDQSAGGELPESKKTRRSTKDHADVKDEPSSDSEPKHNRVSDSVRAIRDLSIDANDNNPTSTRTAKRSEDSTIQYNRTALASAGPTHKPYSEQTEELSVELSGRPSLPDHGPPIPEPPAHPPTQLLGTRRAPLAWYQNKIPNRQSVQWIRPDIRPGATYHAKPPKVQTSKKEKRGARRALVEQILATSAAQEANVKEDEVYGALNTLYQRSVTSRVENKDDHTKTREPKSQPQAEKQTPITDQSSNPTAPSAIGGESSESSNSKGTEITSEAILRRIIREHKSEIEFLKHLLRAKGVDQVAIDEVVARTVAGETTAQAIERVIGNVDQQQQKSDYDLSGFTNRFVKREG